MSDGYPDGGPPAGYEQILPGTVTAVGLTSIPVGASRAQVAVSVQAVRYRDDGVDPTSAVGFPKAVGSNFVYAGNLSKVKFIAVSGGAVLDVLYYK